MFPYVGWVMDLTLLEHKTKYEKYTKKWYKECKFKEKYRKTVGISSWLTLHWNINLLKVVL